MNKSLTNHHIVFILSFSMASFYMFYFINSDAKLGNTTIFYALLVTLISTSAVILIEGVKVIRFLSATANGPKQTITTYRIATLYCHVIVITIFTISNILVEQSFAHTTIMYSGGQMTTETNINGIRTKNVEEVDTITGLSGQEYQIGEPIPIQDLPFALPQSQQIGNSSIISPKLSIMLNMILILLTWRIQVWIRYHSASKTNQ